MQISIMINVNPRTLQTMRDIIYEGSLFLSSKSDPQTLLLGETTLQEIVREIEEKINGN